MRNNYYSFDFLSKLESKERDKKILANTLLVYFEIIEIINIEEKKILVFT